MKNILITGGTGSFGQAFVEFLLKSYKSKIKRIVVFSRDEFKQFQMSLKFLGQPRLTSLIAFSF